MRRCDQSFADRRAADDDLREALGRVGAEALDRAGEDFHRRQRRERRLLRRFPDHRIAADQRQRGVPGPDRDREIERGNDRAGPERMPGLGHPVAGALRGDDEAVQLPRQADGEIADVDHLLHFAQALGHDLADLERHEGAESLLRGAQFLAEKAHELAAAGRRNLAPGEKGVPRAVDDRRHVVSRRLSDAGDLGPVDRRADGERTAAKLRWGQARAFEHVLAGHRFRLIRLSVRRRRREASLRPQFRPPGKSKLVDAAVRCKISAGLIRTIALFRLQGGEVAGVSIGIKLSGFGSTSYVRFFCFCSASCGTVGKRGGLSTPSTGFRRRADLSGVFRIFDRSVFVVAADAARPMKEGVGAVGIDVDLDPRLDEMGAHRAWRDLQFERAVGHAIVMADLPLLLDAQDLVEVDARNGGEGRAFAGRIDGEPGVVGGQVDLANEGVGRLDIGYAGERQLVDEPVLKRPERPLRSAPGPRACGE